MMFYHGINILLTDANPTSGWRTSVWLWGNHTSWMSTELTSKLQVAGKLFEVVATQIASVALQSVDAGLQYLAVTDCCLSTCMHPLWPVHFNQYKHVENFIQFTDQDNQLYIRCSIASSSELPDEMLPTSTRICMRWEGKLDRWGFGLQRKWSKTFREGADVIILIAKAAFAPSEPPAHHVPGYVLPPSLRVPSRHHVCFLPTLVSHLVIEDSVLLRVAWSSISLGRKSILLID